VLASKALPKIHFRGERPKILGIDQQILGDDRIMCELAYNLTVESNEQKLHACSIIAYISYKQPGMQQKLFEYHVAEPILDMVSLLAGLENVVLASLCDLISFWCVQMPYTPHLLVESDVQDLVEQRLEALIDLAKSSSYIRDMLQILADFGNNSCIQNALRLNGLGIDENSFMKNAAALQCQLETDLVRCLEPFETLSAHPFCTFNWEQVKSHISDIEIANLMRFMVQTCYLRTSVAALKEGKERGPFSFQLRCPPHFTQYFHGRELAFGGFDIRELQIFSCKCGIFDEGAEELNFFGVLWVHFKIRGRACLLIAEESGGNFRFPGGRNYRPSSELLRNRNSIAIHEQEFWPCRERCITAYKVDGKRAFGSIEEAESALGPVLHEVEETMGPRFSVRFRSCEEVDKMFVQCQVEGDSMQSTVSSSPQYFYQSVLRKEIEAFLYDSQYSAGKQLIKVIQIIGSCLARWSKCSEIYWHEYHIHLKEKLDYVSHQVDRGGHSILHGACFVPDIDKARTILSFAPELAIRTNYCAGDVPAHYCTYFSLDKDETGKWSKYTRNLRFDILKLLFSKNSLCIFVKNKDGCTPHDVIDVVCKSLGPKHVPYKEEALLMRNWLFNEMKKGGWVRDPELGWLDARGIGDDVYFLGKCSHSYKGIGIVERQYADFRSAMLKTKENIEHSITRLDCAQKVFFLACSAGDLEAVRSLFNSNPRVQIWDRPLCNSYQTNVLSFSNTEITKYLLDLGFSTWSSAGIFGYTAYHLASLRSLETLEVLLRRNPLGVFFKCTNGRTPLELISRTDDSTLKKWSQDELGSKVVSEDSISQCREATIKLLGENEKKCLDSKVWKSCLSWISPCLVIEFLQWRLLVFSKSASDDNPETIHPLDDEHVSFVFFMCFSPFCFLLSQYYLLLM
jgi:hypothetical protein